MVVDRCKICYRYIGKEGIELKVDDKVLRFCCETCLKKFKDKATEDMKESCGLRGFLDDGATAKVRKLTVTG